MACWETETQTDLLWRGGALGGVLVVTQDPAEAQPVQVELHGEGASRVRGQLLPPPTQTHTSLLLRHSFRL